MENKLLKIKKIAMASVCGICVMLILQLLGAVLIERGILSANMLTLASVAAVFSGTALASFLAGGKIYGIIAFAVMFLFLWLMGLVFFKGGAGAGNMLLPACSAALGAAVGIVGAAVRK